MASSSLLSGLSLSYLFLLCHLFAGASAQFQLGRPKIFMPTETNDRNGGKKGTTWALLVAGSNGFGNYRHQADVCHAFQILKKGGVKEENIVVFMYDDIANNANNPRPGIIINHPNGSDVYAGVPKDYTGDHITLDNLFAVLLGNKKGVKGGSGKVIDSKPEDRIFIYYTDHGGPGMLGMPNLDFIYANDLIEVFKKKHKMGTYKEMVVYVESCESGSMFEGLMPRDLNIYVMTASNAKESSWGAYCPGMATPPPSEFTTCLGDLFSVAWMEDSEKHNLKLETIAKQYVKVKERTSNHNVFSAGSHVMEYGTLGIKKNKLYLYQGFDPANANVTDNIINHVPTSLEEPAHLVNQRDADLYFLIRKYKRADEKSKEKALLLEEIAKVSKKRAHIDASVGLIGKFLFGSSDGPSILQAVRPSGWALVDDWTCLKSMVKLFETHCGKLTQYGMKHSRAFANICNKGVSTSAMKKACINACGIRTLF